jgi:regulator of sigma D
MKYCKRISMIVHLQTIYLDICIYENSTIYIKDEITKKLKTIDLGKLKCLLDIFPTLDKLIHPRYTKVIIDGGATTEIVIDYIDNKHNRFVEKDDFLILEDVMFEMVEVRKATRQEIKDWKKKEIF